MAHSSELAALSALGAFLAALAAGSPAAAQADGASCRDSVRPPFPAPAASPLEPHTRLAAVHVDRGPRSRWVALADLGERIPFWIRRGCGRTAEGGSDAPGDRAGTRPGGPGDPPGPQLAGSVAAGVFSRFDLERNGNELVQAHYRAGLRLRARLGAMEGRLEAYHVSSHLGDEFLERTGRAPVSTSREGLELLVQARPASRLRIYGGPGVLVRSTRGLGAGSLRGGAEWDGAAGQWGGFTPYASVEVYSWEELDWEPLLAAEAGVGLGGGRFRFAVLAGAGPSRAEQFLGGPDETLLGGSFSVSW